MKPTSRWSRRQVVAIAATIPAAMIASSPGAGLGQASPTPGEVADVSGPVDIGGRMLHLECRGTGAPTVVLVSGAGNNGQIWDTIALPANATADAVLPGVARFTGVCAYDRPNTFLDPDHPSRSTPVANPRSAAEMVTELRALLVAADVPGPYVLVGHSFGGLLVRLFAAEYPDEVAGLVLVDAAHEDWWDTLDALLTPDQRVALNAEPEGYPGLEQIDTTSSADQMRQAAATSPSPAIPLIVLTHGHPWDWPAGYPADAIEAAWIPLQENLASLVPDARLVIAEESGHYIQLDQPDLVTDAIRQVVDAVRSPSP